jgi:hypothetical protein
MSIQAPQGILNIPNATLRVGRLEISEVVGADTILNTVARNTILLVDDEAYHENKNWALKLPNAWAGEFECNTASAGNYSEFNFYNEGASSNVQGYNLTFNDTAVELRYDGTLLKTGTLASTITGTGVKKVRLMFERTILSVTVDGTLVFTHDDTVGPRPRVYSTTAGGFLNFFTDGGALKNLKIVNEKWMSDGTSNIAYVGGGEVAVGQALAFNRVSNVSQIKVDSNVVTEYTGPHDRPLRKYPEIILPRAAVGADYNGYRIERSSEYVTGPYLGVQSLFNNTAVDYADTWGAGINGTNFSYSASTGEHTAYVTGGTTQGTAARLASNVPNGEWVSLKSPNAIKLDNIQIRSRNASDWFAQFPTDFQIWGSNDGTTWSHIKTFTGQSASGQSILHTYHINSTIFYNRHALVVTKIPGETSSGANDGAAHLSISELRFNGHEEGSGSLDTTLKSVYNVPATTGTQLEVYYDAKDLAEMPSIVTDLAGGDQNGTVTGHSPTLDETNGIESFKFDGVDDYITTTLTNPNTDWVHSVSMWVYPIDVSVDSVNGYMFAIGAEVSNQVSALRFSPDGFQYTRWAGGGARNFNGPVTSGRWHHVTLVSPGSTDVQVYLDGRLLGYTSDSLAALTLPQNTSLSVGRFAASVSYSRPFDGSIANFRLYSKALNAGQIQELYDYQKDYFLGSKSQVTLYKGHLGVGVTEPSGQLELAGDERIQEYPPGPMDDYETLIPGHGVFTASASSQYHPNYAPWKAFRKFWDTDDQSWASSNETVTKETGLPSSTAANFQGILGNWIQLKLPYKIDLHSFKFESRDNVNYAPEELPGAGIVYGSNDEVTWDIVHSFSGVDYGGVSGTLRPVFTVKSNTSYSIFRLLVTKNYLTRSDIRWAGMGAWRLFGTPGPTTLDKGSLTLGRSLDVPRISRYDVDTETPRPEKLVLDFDTTVNSSPTDISGKGNHGTFNGTDMNYSSADKAFVFNGTDDYIDIPSVSGVGTGAWVHSMSFWFKIESNDLGVMFLLGRNGDTRQLGVQYNGPASQFQYYIYGCNARVQVNGADWLPDLNRWYHCVTIFKNSETTAGGSIVTGREMYIDGVKQTLVATGNQIALDLDSSEVRFGNQFNSIYMDYQLSNPKIYSVALEPSEVKKLYNLGRTGRSMVISDTAVGIGKVPEAQLDVRGSLVVRGGNVMIRQDDIQVRLATDPGYLSQFWGGSMFIANPSTSGGYEHFIMNNSTTGSHQTTYFSFRRNNSQIGSILTSTGSTISFNTGSDYRLKENIVPMSNEGLVVINKLQPKTFNFKTNPGETVYGFIAHELQEHIPMAVSGEKDEMRGEEPMYQGVDASKIVPWLVKAIQELYEENQAEKAKNESLETQVSDLLARVTALENA